MSTIDPSRNINQPWLYAVWVNNTGNYSQILTGGWKIVQRVAVATADTGNILLVNPPFLNSTYQLQFSGPKVECEAADPLLVQDIDILIEKQISVADASSITQKIDYFAFVLINSSTNSTSILGYPISVISGNRVEQPANATNQLWLAFSRYSNGSSCQNPSNISRQHMVCTLCNAFYTVNLTFENGIQTINGSNYTLGEVVYPVANASVLSISPNLHTLRVSGGLVIRLSDLWDYTTRSWPTEAPGVISVRFRLTSKIPLCLVAQISMCSSIGSTIARAASRNACPSVSQRAQYIGLTRNDNLNILIPELSFNTTMSFLTNDLLS